MKAAERVELVQGTLEFLILKTLSQGKPLHGYNILQFIKSATDEALTIEEGALYPALHRMERKGWIESDWGLSERNRKAKFYALTKAGEERLAVEQDGWARYVTAVGKIMQHAEELSS